MIPAPFQIVAFDLPGGPLRFEFLSAPVVALLFVLLALPIVALGKATLRWHSPRRAWTAISLRLAGVWVLILLIAGARWELRNRDLDVMVLRDISTSTTAVAHPRDRTLCQQVDDYLKSADARKKKNDRIGVVSFNSRALIDAVPQSRLRLGTGPVRDDNGAGTDLAAAVQLGLAGFRDDAMRRLVLITDGNATQGDTAKALEAALAAGVPVDMVPLHYEVRDEVLVDRVTAPAWKRQGEWINLGVVMRSTNTQAAWGRIEITDRHRPIDLDPKTEGMQSSVPVLVQPGTRTAYVKVPPLGGGVHILGASYVPDEARQDTLAANNVAEAMVVVRGRMRVLYVDHEAGNSGEALLSALRAGGIAIADEDHITSDTFPCHADELQNYDAVVLANVPRGEFGGLSLSQERALVQYVRDLGGGLVVLGGPEALGAGRWQNSDLEKILPLNMDPPQQRTVPPGALVLVIDHSGSMADPMGYNPPRPKQRVADESAVQAIQALLDKDYLGVVAFDTKPTWVVPFGKNENAEGAIEAVRRITPGGGTSIYPALQQAADALLALPQSQARVKHILLLTDGVSADGDYDALLAQLRRANISLSTVAIGSDSDRDLLGKLAKVGGGESYVVRDPNKLAQVFVREARTLRRPLIHQPPGGIPLAFEAFPPLAGVADQLASPPPLSGMLLSAVKPDPSVRIPLRAATDARDPILAHWQIGLGRAAVFTADATSRWSNAWINSPLYGNFWPHVMRSVARSPATGDFDVRTIRDGGKTRLIVDATAKSGEAHNFLTIKGKLAGPDARKAAADVVLQQTGPGRYETTLDTPDAGTYFAAMKYQTPSGESGSLLTGTLVPTAPELRDLHSNELFLEHAAEATGGRVLRGGFDNGASLFSREGLKPSISYHPLREFLLQALMAIILMDVAVRRIAWDWPAIKKWSAFAGQQVQSFLTTRTVEPAAMLAALHKVRSDVAEQRFKRMSAPMPPPMSLGLPPVMPDDPSPVTERRLPPVPTVPAESLAGNLMAAKIRAAAVIKQIEQPRRPNSL